jgi:hypothetical protein
MRLLTLAFAGLISGSALADVPAVGGPSLMFSRDKATGTSGLAFESNAAVAFFNVSLALRHWDGAITGWNGRTLNNEGAVYVGLGLLNLIQVQRGFSNAGARTRIRADISLSEDFPFASETKKWGRFKQGIVLTPFVETAFGKKVYGLGIGLTLD